MMDHPVSVEDVFAVFKIQNKAADRLNIAIGEVNIDG
jgi:hypothetical protein